MDTTWGIGIAVGDFSSNAIEKRMKIKLSRTKFQDSTGKGSTSRTRIQIHADELDLNLLPKQLSSPVSGGGSFINQIELHQVRQLGAPLSYRSYTTVFNHFHVLVVLGVGMYYFPEKISDRICANLVWMFNKISTVLTVSTV